MSIGDLQSEHAAMDRSAKVSGRGIRIQGKVLQLAIKKGCCKAKKYAETQHWNVRGPT